MIYYVNHVVADNLAPLPVFDDEIEDVANKSCPVAVERCLSDGDLPDLRMDVSSGQSNASQTSSGKYRIFFYFKAQNIALLINILQ